MEIKNAERVKELLELFNYYQTRLNALELMQQNNIEITLFKSGKESVMFNACYFEFNNELYLSAIMLAKQKITDITIELKSL
jgi:hypothetical protein